VKIFATDTADKSLSLARNGVFSRRYRGRRFPDRLDRFFDKSEHTYQVKKEIREMVRVRAAGTCCATRRSRGSICALCRTC
jgi:chemotaxis methyl-accepting protein methylase